MAGLLTADAARWYQPAWSGIDARVGPSRTATEDLPRYAWLNPSYRGQPGSLGGYWDVYRMSFPGQRPVRGIPFRSSRIGFPEWSSDLPKDGHPDIVVGRRYQGSRGFVDRPCSRAAKILERGAGYVIVTGLK